MATKHTRKARGRKTASLEHTGPEEDAATSKEKATKPKQFRKAAQDEIGKTYKQIVKTLATEAVGGSVQHTKLLFDLGGVKEEVRAASSRRRKPPSLGKLLLDEAAAMKRSKETDIQSDDKIK